MPDHWQETTLGDVAVLEYGKALKESDRDGIGFPVFGSAGEVGRHSVPLVTEGPVIIVGRKGTAGSVHWSPEPCSVIDTAYWVRLVNENLRTDFAFYAISSLNLPSLSAQTGVPGLNRERAYSQPFGVPPVEEQRRIVDLVESIDTYIDGLETQVEATRTARSALLSELLSNPGEDWQETTLGVHASVRTGSLDVNASVKGGRYPFFTCAREIYEIDTAAFSGPSTLVAGNGDFNVKYFDGEFNAYQRTYVIQSITPTSLAHRYLNLILEVAIEKIRLDSRGTTIKYLKKGQFTDYSFALPPISDQKMIVDLVGSFDEQILSLESQVESVRALRTGVLSELLAGECLLDDSYDMAVGL